MVAVAALGLMLAACGGAQAKKFTKADTEQIRQRTQEMVAALNAKDAGKAAEFYAASATFMPPNEATIHGRDSVKGYYQGLLDSGAADLTMEQKAFGGEGAVAFVNGTYSVTLMGKSGNTYRDRGKYLFVLGNNGGQWRCEYSIWNSDLPQTEQGDR
jgi:uncharacterized protein (TIGR02246 family)